MQIKFLLVLFLILSVPAFSQRRATTAAEKVVWGSIKFGDSREAYGREVPVPEVSIGQYTYIFYPFFNRQGQLQSLAISSENLKYEQEDILLLKMVHLSMLITSRYGAPKIESELPALRPGMPDEPLVYKVWHIGDKVITLGLARQSPQ